MQYQILILMIACAALIPMLPIVIATPGELSKSVGIALSKNSMIMLQNDIEVPVTIKQLYDLNLDTSNQRISGDFKIINNVFQRDQPKVINHFRSYDFDKSFNIFIDPSSDMRSRIKMIFIENNFQEYFLSKDMIKENNTRVIHVQRYVDDKCRNATISADDWKILLADTIEYLRSNCTHTTFVDKKIVIDNATVTDITTSQKYKEQKWKDSIKQTHKESKIGKDDSVNKSVVEDKDPKYIPPKHLPFNYTKIK